MEVTGASTRPRKNRDAEAVAAHALFLFVDSASVHVSIRHPGRLRLRLQEWAQLHYWRQSLKQVHLQLPPRQAQVRQPSWRRSLDWAPAQTPSWRWLPEQAGLQRCCQLARSATPLGSSSKGYALPGSSQCPALRALPGHWLLGPSSQGLRRKLQDQTLQCSSTYCDAVIGF